MTDHITATSRAFRLAITTFVGAFALCAITLATGCAKDHATTMPATTSADNSISTRTGIPADARIARARSGDFLIAYIAEPRIIPSNELFALDIWMIHEDGTPVNPEHYELIVDADMPQHGHGMIVQPSIQRLDNGHYRVTDMLFHMPGYWELYFDVRHDGITERTQFPVDIE